MVGVKIGEIHSYDDWGLILIDKVVSPPVPQIDTVSVPLRDGSLDLTEKLTEDVKYSDRKITLTFAVMDPVKEWSFKMSTVLNYLHGQRLKIVFDDDPAYYYIGRVGVNEWTSNKKPGILVVECTVEPFKYDVLSSAVDWEWDIFDLKDGIINETGELIVNGSVTITLICRKKRMFPIFTASAAMAVTFKNETFNLAVGAQKIYELFLTQGENELTFTGNGTVAIEYIGGSL